MRHASEMVDNLLRMVNTGEVKTCGCGDTYYGAYAICPACYEAQERSRKAKERVVTVESKRDKAIRAVSRDTNWMHVPPHEISMLIDKLVAAYPQIDIAEEIPKISCWLMVNPRDTKDLLKLLVSWVSRKSEDRR